MPDSRGHVELQRSIDSIQVGDRHRRETGDLKPLMDSLERVGLLQPVTITPGGYLICGFRRLEAARKLGWNNLRVWVRSGLSDDLTRLLAERDDNITHKPLSAYEAAQLYDEMFTLIQEDANRRQRATRFGAANHDNSAESNGGAESASPESEPLGPARRRAAELITGTASYTRLSQIVEMERVAADTSRRPAVRKVAADELERIRNGGAVDPGYQRVRAVIAAAEAEPPDEDPDFDARMAETLAMAKADKTRRIKENRVKRASAAATARRSVRSFALVWGEMEGWSKHYDAASIARDLGSDGWDTFLRVLDETKTFAESVELARTSVTTSSPTTEV